MTLNVPVVERLPISVINSPLTIFARGRGSGIADRMQARTTKAGGCFLTVCILLGFPLGLAIGDPMKGILIGTAAGILLALITWLIDSRRAR